MQCGWAMRATRLRNGCWLESLKLARVVAEKDGKQRCALRHYISTIRKTALVGYQANYVINSSASRNVPSWSGWLWPVHPWEF